MGMQMPAELAAGGYTKATNKRPEPNKPNTGNTHANA
jgi:hypothetical protein